MCGRATGAGLLSLAIVAAMLAGTACNFEDSLLGRLFTDPDLETDSRMDVEEFGGAADPTWFGRARLPGPQVESAVGAADGRLYVVAAGTDLAVRFDPAAQGGAGAWEALPRLPEPRWGALALAVSSTVYVLSGIGADGLPSGDMEVLDGAAASPAWVSPSITLPFAPARRGLAACVLDGAIYLFGGADKDGVASDEGWRFDPAAPPGSQWTAIGRMTTARVLATAFAFGGKVHVLGGHAGDGVPLASEDVFDPGSGTYASVAVPTARLEPQVVVIADRALVLASRTSDYGRTQSVDVLTGSTWTRADGYPLSVRMPAAAAFEGKAVVAGGRGKRESVRSVYAYDPATGRWSELPAMPTRRHAALAVVLAGRFFVIGGYRAREEDRSSGWLF